MRFTTLTLSLGLAWVVGSGLALGQQPVAEPDTPAPEVERPLPPLPETLQPAQGAAGSTPAARPAPRQTTPGTTPTPPRTPQPISDMATAIMSAPPTASPFFGAGAASGGLLSTSTLTSGSNPQMIGDQAPLFLKQQVTIPQVPGLPNPTPPGVPPPPPSPRLATALVPSVRGFKIAENQSPQPQDRVFFTFNYFTDLNGALNRAFESPVNNLRAYRYIFGFEKTFDDGYGSFGMRLPLNTLTANSAIAGRFNRPGGTSTSLGDLGLFAKYILKLDPKTGSLISAGIQITPPTGPNQFAGANYIASLHDTQIEPFLGYLWIRDRFYFHGFTSLSVPSTVRDVTMVYNDLGMGYFVMQSPDPNRFLTSIAPTFEVHVNTPLTHRDAYNPNDIAGTPDVVDLTYGINVLFRGQGLLTFGVVTPVTGPRPFNTEYLMLFNLRFGRSRRNAAVPILGG